MGGRGGIAGVCVYAYCICGEFRRVVVDISYPDDSGGSVGKAVGGVSLHVSGLDDQGVLRDFLEINRKQRQSKMGRIIYLHFHRISNGPVDADISPQKRKY